MSRITRVRGAVDDIFWASRKVIEPIIYLPSFAKPTRKAFNRRSQAEVPRVVEEAAYPSDNYGKRGKYPCRGLDLNTALYDCRERRIYIGEAGCTELHICSSNILRDPGFEVEANGFKIPNYVAGLTYEPDIHDDLGNHAYTAQLGWACDSNTTFSPFIISTSDPRSGSKHLHVPDKTVVGNGPHRLYVVKGIVCANKRFIYGARVEPGNVVTLSGYLKTDDPFSGVNVRLIFEWYNSSFGFIDSDSSGFETVQTTYTQHSFSGDFYPAAPAGAYYLHAYFSITMGGAQTTSVVEVDDAVLEVDCCTDTLITGSNILRDPGFENHLANIPPGPNGEIFPGEWGGGFLYPYPLHWESTMITDLTYYQVNNWGVFSNTQDFLDPDTFQRVSDVNPRSGTYHYRHSYNPLNDSISNAAISPVTDKMCEEFNDQLHAYSARINPGMTVSLSLYAMANTTTSNPYVYADVSYYGTNGRSLGSSTELIFDYLTTSYTQYAGSNIAPANAYVCIVTIYLEHANSEDVALTIDADDFELGITA